MSSIEEKVQKMCSLTDDINMKLCACKFFENVSFNEAYIDKVLETNKNKQTINLHNTFKAIRNGGIKK